MTQVNGNVPAQQAPAQNQQSSLAKFNEDTVSNVLTKISGFQTNGDLKLPPDYSAENAVRSAWLMLQETVDMNKNLVLQSCSKESIANALLNMVVQGLNPIKKQCYFVPYGGKLLMQKSYMGTIAIAKRVGDVNDVVGNVIYMDDEFEYEIDPATGRKKIIKHIQKIENIDLAKIKGFYAIVIKNDKTVYTEIMTLSQVTSAWNMGNAKGGSPAHKQFPDQMGMKTVVNRALKVVIGSSDDSSLYEDEEPAETQFTANVKKEISDNANKDEIGFDEIPGTLQTEDLQPMIHIPHQQQQNNSQQAKAPF